MGLAVSGIGPITAREERMKTALGVALAILLVGCVTTMGQDMDVSKASELKPGISTLDDAKEMFGQPGMAMNNPSQPGTCYSWTYVRAVPFGSPDVKQVHLCFDPQGRYVTNQPQPVPVKVVQ